MRDPSAIATILRLEGGSTALNITTVADVGQSPVMARPRLWRDRPWYRWSLLTWLALVLVASAVIYCHWLGPRAHRTDYRYDLNPGLDEIDYVGWPFLATERHLLKPQLRPGTVEFSRVYHPLGILGNVAVAVLLLFWIVLVVERMDRNSGRSTSPQFIAVGGILAGTVLLSRFREPIWDSLVARLPRDLSVVFEIASDSRPGWMHTLHYGMSLAVVNAIVVATWYAVAGVINAFLAALQRPEAS